MRAPSIRSAMALLPVLLALVCAAPARGDENRDHVLGDHPAIVVQRLYKAAGYDYASKFYPHPAWLHLYAEPPGDPIDTVRSLARLPDISRPLAEPLQGDSRSRSTAALASEAR